MVGAYAALFLPAFAGHQLPPSAGPASIFWNWLFFYLFWKRRGRKGWHGGLIGAGVGLVVFVLAAFIGGMVRGMNAL
jgi:hypothetical protein